MNRVAIGDGAFIGLFLTCEHFEERGFTRAVRADHADNAAWGQGKGEAFDEELVAHRFFEAVHFDHLAAKAWAIGNDDLGAADFFTLGLACQLVIGVDTGLLLGLAGFLALAHPLKFALKRLLLGFVFFGLLGETLGFLLQPCGVVALVGDAFSAVELQNPACDIVKEVAVVGDAEDCACVVDQVLLEPSDGFGVKVVGRFVEQKHVRRFEEQFAERNAAGFTA